MKIIKKIISSYYLKKYKKVGTIFGDHLSYFYMGKSANFDELKKDFFSLESKIIELGFCPYSIDDFISCGGYGVPLMKEKKLYSSQEAAKIVYENKKEIEEIESKMNNFNIVDIIL